jgi:hypothetical protein
MMIRVHKIKKSQRKLKTVPAVSRMLDLSFKPILKMMFFKTAQIR